MSTQVVIMFPYSGYNPDTPKGKQRKEIFWKIVKTCRGIRATEGRLPIVILNRDTENRKQADAFLADERANQDEKTKQISIRRTWSVDTCQMWLSGWGDVLDAGNIKEDDRIVQLPGDIDEVNEDKGEQSFFGKLGTFIAMVDWDIVVGDFTSGNTFNPKELVDLYGTFALMANWFPEVAQSIRQLPLKKPRSEFLNIQVKTLRKLLEYRKFAYEQTLNMLIRSWDSEKKDWKYNIKAEALGALNDDSTFRQYRDCLDQIERTERMLKLLWREIYEPKYPDQQDFIDQYDRLDRHSTSIRENARIIIRNLLGLGPQ